MDINANTTTDMVVSHPHIDKEGNVDLTTVSTDDTKKYEEVSKSLVPGDANAILNYGAEVEKSMDKYSNDFLTSVRTFNSGEVGAQINELLTELNYIDVDELEQSGFKSFMSKIPFFKKMVMDVKSMFQKYDTVIANVDKITNKIKAGRINSLKDNTALHVSG